MLNNSRKQCQEIGINGVKIKSEIISLAKDLPETYEKITEEAKGLDDAAELYQSTVQSRVDEGVEIKVNRTYFTQFRIYEALLK